MAFKALDVYCASNEQAQSSSRGSVICFSGATLDLAHSKFDDMAPFESVSYTHLDVYKRQIYMCFVDLNTTIDGIKQQNIMQIFVRRKIHEKIVRIIKDYT